MAVSDFQAPNLAPAYGNITDQLKNTATLALKTPSPLEPVSRTIDTANVKLDDLDKQKFEVGKLYLQHKFDTELQKSQQEFQKRGEVQVDDETIANAKKEFGVDISKWKGTWVQPDELAKSLEQQHGFLTDEKNKKKIQATMDDTTLNTNQKATRIAGLSDTKTIAAQAAKEAFADRSSKMTPVADKNSSTGWYYAQPDETGNYVKTTLEAPAPKDGASAAKNISSKDRDAVIDRNRMADQIQGAVDNYNPNFVGLFDSKKAASEQATGQGASKQQGLFLQSVNGMKNQLLKLRNGQRITQAEYDRLLNEVPDNAKSEEDFTDKMRVFAEDFNSTQDQYKQSLAEGGFKGVPEHKSVTIPDNFGPGYQGKKATAKIPGNVDFVWNPSTKKLEPAKK